MSKNYVSGLVLGGIMALSAVATVQLTPHIHLASIRPAFVLDSVIPRQFGDWVEEENQMAAVVNPETAAMLKRIYSQTLSRSYINRDGGRVMLSVAYGGDQSDGMQVHYPEVCYPAQGFQLMSERRDVLPLQAGKINVKRLEMNLSGQRFEPVTYWTTVGDEVVSGGLSKKLAEMKYGVRGEIPDGLLFRVSSIDRDSARAFALQDGFVQQLATALDQSSRRRLMGLAP